MSLRRLRELAGVVPGRRKRLREADEPMSGEIVSGGPDDEDPDDAAREQRYARERRIVALIQHAFARLGLGILTNDVTNAPAIIYDEEDQRTARVDLDDYEADLAALSGLLKSGLGTQFRLIATNDGLDVEFRVDPALDGAVAG